MEKRTRRWTATLAILVVGALTMAPTALAQSTGTGYEGQGGVAGQVSQGGGVAGQVSQGGGGVAGETASGNGNAASESAGGNGVLAFSGLDLVLLAGGGLVLLLGGVAMGRLVARPQH